MQPAPEAPAAPAAPDEIEPEAPILAGAPEPETLAAPDEIEPEAPILTGAPDLSETQGDEAESLAEATLIEPRSGPEAEERAYEEALVDEGAPQDAAPDAEAADETFSPFATADDTAPERSRRPLLTLLIVVLVIAALAAAFWFLAPPEWKARVGLGSGAASPLALVTTHMDRQQLESGNELLTVSGRVINPTSSEQDVPPLQAQLRTKTGKVVYSWVIAPPAPTLAGGASAPFNSAEINVPPGGDELTITLGSPRA